MRTVGLSFNKTTLSPAAGVLLLFLLPLLLLLPACEESGFFSVDRAQTLSISTLEEGSYVSPGDEVPLSVIAGDPALKWDSVDAVLLDASGEPVQQWSFRAEVFSASRGGSAALPLAGDLPSGMYRIVIEVEGSGGNVLAEKGVSLFCTDFTSRIRSVSSYPAELHPGAVVLLEPDLLWEGDGRPILRWKLENQVIQEEAWTEPGRPLVWKVPEAEGIYPIVLEVFPEGYADGPLGDGPLGDGGWSSSLKAETTIYVSQEITPDPGELGPEDSYRGLFHFRGDFRDEISRSRFSHADPYGFEKMNGVYGYRAQAGESLGIDRSFLPVRGGRLQPFTLSLILGDAQNLPLGSYVEVDQGSGFSLALNRREEGFVLKGRAAGSSFLLDLGQALSPSQGGLFGQPPGSSSGGGGGSRREFSLTGIPREGGWRFLFYEGGQLLGGGDVSGSISGLPSRGKTRLARWSGGSCLLDEFGVYFRNGDGEPAPDSRLFQRAAASAFPGRILLAEGFDRMDPPRSGQNGGDGAVATGASLILPPGEALILDGGRLYPNSRYHFSGRFEGGAIGLAWAGRKSPFLVLFEDGRVVHPEVSGFSAEPADGASLGNPEVPGGAGPPGWDRIARRRVESRFPDGPVRGGFPREWEFLLREGRMRVSGVSDYWVDRPVENRKKGEPVGLQIMLLSSGAGDAPYMEADSLFLRSRDTSAGDAGSWLGREADGQLPDSQGF